MKLILDYDWKFALMPLTVGLIILACVAFAHGVKENLWIEAALGIWVAIWGVIFASLVWTANQN